MVLDEYIMLRQSNLLKNYISPHSLISHLLPMSRDKIYKGPNYWGRGFWIKSCRNNIVEIILTGDDVLVVEAQNRIGGRLKTTDTSQSKLGINYDLGHRGFMIH